ncbi:MAG: phosphopentomutase, partial [Bacilli bacterium]
MTLFNRIVLIVLDSVGIGELPDAEKFGDKGSNTLGHIAEYKEHLFVPNMKKLGLGNIEQLKGIEKEEKPEAYYGKMAEVSIGKDTTTGHWEIMGLHVDTPFHTYPDGFPAYFIAEFVQKIGRNVLANV